VKPDAKSPAWRPGSSGGRRRAGGHAEIPGARGKKRVLRSMTYSRDGTKNDVLRDRSER
jgi:hypothetical protein